MSIRHPSASTYRYAAACLASDHAALRLQNALAAFVHSLQEPSSAHAPLATALSTRLALLREITATAPPVEDSRGDGSSVRRAA